MTESHLSSPYVCFRRSAARNPALPADAVIRLLDDGSGVRTTIAAHAPHLVDPATAERIDRDFRARPVAEALPERDDLVYPHGTVRDAEGVVVDAGTCPTGRCRPGLTSGELDAFAFSATLTTGPADRSRITFRF
ncbi:hypothetical protein [Micromonospora antibiotica]|uniref:hypothetical protein n=1 Tax=Micromonospora antibiotica TaxID=2807623 RepID=UPI001FC926F0|nr:hypothetical protein [Micromonospora antibiotica]